MEGYKDYQIVIHIPLKAVDDSDAHMRTRSILGDFRTAGLLGLEETGGVSEKLQRLEKGKDPEVIAL